jgi:Lar family restriction alleviation protein
MSDLKPCPFCGKEPNQTSTELGDRPCFYYECDNPKCGATEMGWHNTEQEARDAWNNRPIEDALRKEIAKLQADNRSLVEQMNQTALKHNQEIIEWHQHPLYPETSRCCIVECTDNCFYIAHHSDIDGWLNSATYEQLSNVKSWAYLPKGANHEC